MARKYIDLLNASFGSWRVVSIQGRTPSGQAAWLCRCKCGATRVHSSQILRTGKTKSCGCLGNKRGPKGYSNHPLYGIWYGMMERCQNPKATNYANYGGRGIAVCQEWQESFEAFAAEVGDRPTPEHSLDRIDNGGNYQPGNVRWATHRVQHNNKRNNHIVAYRGEKMTLAEAYRMSGATISRWAVDLRIMRGMSAADALDTPRNMA